MLYCNFLITITIIIIIVIGHLVFFKMDESKKRKIDNFVDQSKMNQSSTNTNEHFKKRDGVSKGYLAAVPSLSNARRESLYNELNKLGFFRDLETCEDKFLFVKGDEEYRIAEEIVARRNFLSQIDQYFKQLYVLNWSNAYHALKSPIMIDCIYVISSKNYKFMERIYNKYLVWFCVECQSIMSKVSANCM